MTAIQSAIAREAVHVIENMFRRDPEVLRRVALRAGATKKSVTVIIAVRRSAEHFLPEYLRVTAKHVFDDMNRASACYSTSP